MSEVGRVGITLSMYDVFSRISFMILHIVRHVIVNAREQPVCKVYRNITGGKIETSS
jgi:hypothetical protein